MLLCLLGLPAALSAQAPRDSVSLAAIIRTSATMLTGSTPDMSQLLHDFQALDPLIQYRRNNHLRHAETGDSSVTFFLHSGTDDMPVLDIYFFSLAQAPDSISASGAFHVGCGYRMVAGKASCDCSKSNRLSLADMEQAFGKFTAAPANKFRKEHNEYFFFYRNRETGRHATICVSCSFDAHSLYNYIGMVYVFAF